jgi:hypothetical protein
MRHLRWVPPAGVLVFAACGGSGGNVTTPSNTPPKANFGVTCAERTCSFTDSSTDADGTIQGWLWKFGDDSTSQVQNPVHTYDTAGTYQTTLVVTDNGGATDSITKPAQPLAPSADLTCTDATVAGGPASCSLTLPQTAGIKAVLSDRVPCQAHGDVFAFITPVADTLTKDGCFDPIGTEVDLAPAPAGTLVQFNITSGLTQYMTGVRVTGTYPQWTINVEDAVGAPFAVNYTDMIVTLTAVPSGP